MISEVQGVQYSKCIAYGEAKAANTDNHGKGVHLVRLAVFGKDYIDMYKLNHVITFQIVGISNGLSVFLLILFFYKDMKMFIF